MSSDKLIQVGVIASAHGVRGQVKLRSFTEDPRDILAYAPLTDATGTRVYTLTSHGIKGDSLIVAIEGVTDRNVAEQMKNTAIYAPASLMPTNEENVWYYSELIGMDARTPDGQLYGRVTAVHNFGAGDILEFNRPDGSSEMLPFNSGFIGEVNTEESYLLVFPPDYIEAEQKDA